MPPRTSSSKKTSTRIQGPSREQLEAIKSYLAQKPDLEKDIAASRTGPQDPSQRFECDYERILSEAVIKTFEERRKEAETSRTRDTMPVLPKEEETKGNLTDQVAKESKDSTASDHPLHDKSDKASFEHHKAAPGPVIADKLPEAEDREILRAKAAELNKKS